MAISATSRASSASGATRSIGKCIGCTSCGRSGSRCIEQAKKNGAKTAPLSCRMPISEEEDGPQGNRLVLDLIPRLVLGRGRNILGHQIEAWGEAVIHP